MEGVDLSGWKLAFNGAEPVRAETIRRFTETFAPHGFAAAAMLPAYGMAEATVLVSAGRRGAGPVTRTLSRDGLRAWPCRAARRCATRSPSSAAAARSPASGSRSSIRIQTRPARRRADRRNLGQRAQCRARLLAQSRGERGGIRRAHRGRGAASAGCAPAISASSTRAGELFITGRIKEVVIIRGANHYPQDIEHTVQGCHPALRRHGGAAFTVPTTARRERLVVVQEVERTYRHRIDIDEIVGRIREAVVSEHEIVPYRIALLRPGALPKTTSGKIQRALSRQLWLEGSLERL